MKDGTYFLAYDDHSGSLSASFFTTDELGRRIPVLHETEQQVKQQIADHLQGCKEAVNLGYLQDYEDSGYTVAEALVHGDEIEIGIAGFLVYSGSLYEVEA